MEKGKDSLLSFFACFLKVIIKHTGQETVNAFDTC